VPVEPRLELKQRLPEFLDGIEGLYPKKLLLQGANNRSATPLPSGALTKLGLDSIPRKAISSWNACLMYCGPWSCRSASPKAIPWASGP